MITLNVARGMNNPFMLVLLESRQPKTLVDLTRYDVTLTAKTSFGEIVKSTAAGSITRMHVEESPGHVVQGGMLFEFTEAESRLPSREAGGLAEVQLREIASGKARRAALCRIRASGGNNPDT